MIGIGVLTAMLVTGWTPRAAGQIPPPSSPTLRASSVVTVDSVRSAVRRAEHADADLRGQQIGRPPSQERPRPCDGCPPRSVGKAFLQATVINGVYELANLIRGQVTAHITPKTWWDNMENGWVWDLDDFAVNQIGHPYQGNNYFNAARANGLNFYESAGITAFGSATWEYFGETNMPSLNDFINTTLGGVALGEMFHRAAWLVRDTGISGRGRLWREIGATAIDPVTGINRFLTGDASRVTEKPQEFVPSTLGGFVAAGVLWRGTNKKAIDSAGDPFLETEVSYGDYTQGRSRTPYDAFGVRLTLGGGAAISEVRVRGRLLGQPLRHERAQFSVLQSYAFLANNAYHSGSQSLEATFGLTHDLSETTNLTVLGWGGLTVLGAVDSLPLGQEAPPPEEEEEGSAGQGVSEGPRYYDYGPGTTFGGFVTFRHRRRSFAVLLYEGRTIYSLDGVRANHLLQRWRVDLLAPLRGKLGIGTTGELFDRRSYYQDPARTIKRYHYPQFRVYLTWSLS